MKSKFGPAALATLLCAQGLLGFAALAAILMKESTPTVAGVAVATAPPAGAGRTWDQRAGATLPAGGSNL